MSISRLSKAATTTLTKMKPLGLLGGMTYHATSLYYNQINAHVNARLGGGHSAKLLLQSFDFAETSALMNSNRWDDLAQMFIQAARTLKAGGAKGIVLCVNTGHKVADQLEASLKEEGGVEFLHITDCTAAEIVENFPEVKKVGVLGTRPVCTEQFVKGRLKEKFALEVVVPTDEDVQKMHDIIFGDLGNAIVTDETRRFFYGVVEDMIQQGCGGIVLACTELQFVLKQEEIKVPLFDTVKLHAKGAAEWALSDEQ